jgi:hypothetical protein
VADARDGQTGAPPDAPVAGYDIGEMAEVRSGWPLRRVVIAVVSLAIVGGLVVSVLVLAGPRP